MMGWERQLLGTADRSEIRKVADTVKILPGAMQCTWQLKKERVAEGPTQIIISPFWSQPSVNFHDLSNIRRIQKKASFHFLFQPTVFKFWSFEAINQLSIDLILEFGLDICFWISKFWILSFFSSSYPRFHTTKVTGIQRKTRAWMRRQTRITVVKFSCDNSVNYNSKFLAILVIWGWKVFWIWNHMHYDIIFK